MDKDFSGTQKVTRRTVQKRAVMEVLREANRHLTADEVYEIVKKRVPHISLGTVYRNLEMLAETGQATKVDLGEGKRRFDARTERHHHFRCVKCGHVIDIPYFPMDRLSAFDQASFEITGMQVVLEGVCKECLEKEKGGVKMSGDELNDTQKTVLKVLSELGKPAGNKEIAEKAGLDSKEVTKAIKALKAKGLVDSPVRCKYAPTDSGKG